MNLAVHFLQSLEVGKSFNLISPVNPDAPDILEFSLQLLHEPPDDVRPYSKHPDLNGFRHGHGQ
jgi:hypothetical protein